MATATKAKPKPKPKFKGKYAGPEAFKGNAKMNAAYSKQIKGKKLTAAAKRKIVNSIAKAKAVAPKPAAKPPAAAPPAAPSSYNYADPAANAAASNASGNVQLQSNYELNSAEIEAQNALDQQKLANQSAMDNATFAKESQQQGFNKQKLSSVGSMRQNLAARGLGGASTVATDKDAELRGEFARNQYNIDQPYANAQQAYTAGNLSADTAYSNRLKGITLGRQQYTNERSRTAPTEGSQAENAGVTGIKPTLPAPKAAKPKVVAKPKAKPKFKGKYPGPDKYKGNAKLIAAAKRKAAKK